MVLRDVEVSRRSDTVVQGRRVTFANCVHACVVALRNVRQLDFLNGTRRQRLTFPSVRLAGLLPFLLLRATAYLRHSCRAALN